MRRVFRKAVGAVEEFFMCRGKDFWSNVISRMTLEGMDKRDVGRRLTTKKIFNKVFSAIVYGRKGQNIGRHGSKGGCLMKW